MTPVSFSAALAVLLATSVASAQDGATEAADSTASGAGGGKSHATSADQADLKTEKRDAPADAGPAPRERATAAGSDHESGEDAAYGHGMQFSIRAGFVAGYRMDFRYDRSPLCKAYDPTKLVNDQQKICGFGAPPAAEVALGFAPIDGVEPYVFARFGFSGESQTNTNALQLFGLGARLYTMADSRFKVFIEPAVAYETESGAGNPDWAPTGLSPEYKKDLVFHVGVGPQYDFARAFGMFLNAGIDVGVLRSISAVALVNVGLQLRFP